MHSQATSNSHSDHPKTRSQEDPILDYDEVSVVDESTDSEGEEGRHGQHKARRRRLVDEDDALSLEDLLQEKNSRIEALELANRMKDERLTLLEQKLNDTKVKDKEGIYWLQLELDGARRDHDAVEEHMAELMNDLQNVRKIPNPNEVSEVVLRDATITNYELVIASMENQITMIKTSAGEVVKTLKEEIAELMEDRACMEVTLMNQLAALDREKSVREAEWEHALRSKNDTVHRLLSSGGTASTPADESAYREYYEAEIARLAASMKEMEERMREECGQAYEEVQRLELEKAELKAELDRAEENLELRYAETTQQVDFVDPKGISRERDDAMESLDSVREILKKTEYSMQVLTESMVRLQPETWSMIEDDRKILLSTLQTALLVHEHANVSLSLTELKLRNQFQNLKNDKLAGQAEGAPVDDRAIYDQMKSIQSDVLNVVNQVETRFMSQIRDIERKALKEALAMKSEAQDRCEALKSLEGEQTALEDEIVRLKSIVRNVDGPTKFEERGSAPNPNGSLLNGINKDLLDQLQVEALRVIERVKEKNVLIQVMQKRLEARMASEERLKRELKRALRHSKVASPMKSPGEASDKLSPKPASGQASSSPSWSSPLVTPKQHSRHKIPGAVGSPRPSMPTISPLAPSPRETIRAKIQHLANELS
jgi:hypothetical protein